MKSFWLSAIKSFIGKDREPVTLDHSWGWLCLLKLPLKQQFGGSLRKFWAQEQTHVFHFNIQGDLKMLGCRSWGGAQVSTQQHPPVGRVQSPVGLHGKTGSMACLSFSFPTSSGCSLCGDVIKQVMLMLCHQEILNLPYKSCTVPGWLP